MPGVVYKKKGGKVFPPDWTQIGYDNTPKSTLIGFDYAVDIKDTWDTSIVTHTERYKDNKVLMYWPKNIDTSNLITVDRMFQASNIESVDIDLSNARTATAVFTDCLNLRDAIVHGLGNPDAPNGTLNNIANMFSNCRSLVELDLNLTEYTQLLSAVNLCTDCWELKEFIYDGKSENIARISSLYNAFTNCYKMEKLTVKDDLPEWIGCYAVGSQTANGCLFDIDIGSTSPNGTQATFRKAKIKDGSYIAIKKTTTAQDMFRECIIEPASIIIVNPTSINASYMFMDSTIKQRNFDASVNVSNANGMFKNADFENVNSQIDTLIHFENNTSFNETFYNCNIKTINAFNDRTFANVTTFNNMFYNAKNLDDNTLNSLLLALTTASSYTGTKTLRTLGFTDTTVYPDSRFTALSNYTAFTTAGWSIS